MRKVILLSTLGILTILTASSLHSQVIWNPERGCAVGPNGDCVPNTTLSAVPFLTIIPDAIGGGMGDAGGATHANAYSLHYNASKLAFAEKESSFTASYTPWLRNLGLTDVFLTYLGGYFRISEEETFGAAFRFFSLGDINFTDVNGQPLGSGRPREFELSAAYARKLSPNLSAGLTAKFIYSNLASGFSVGNVDITSGQSFAADLSLSYHSEPDLGRSIGNDLAFGVSISNLGSKISYTNNSRREFIPANLRLGSAYKMNLDEYNSVTFALDVTKLLLPTPFPVDHPEFDVNPQNGVADFRERSTFGGVFGSFTDAPGGFSEELQEFAFSLGAEYWYDQQFAVRAGYYYEHPLKGDRQYLTIGVGLKYNLIGIDIAYLAPTNSQRSPLDNTLRFSFTFDGFDGEAR